MHVRPKRKRSSENVITMAKKAKVQLERITRSHKTAKVNQHDHRCNDVGNTSPAARDGDTSHTEASDDEMPTIKSFEERRLQNMKDNANFLHQLGITQAKEVLNAAHASTRKKPLQKGLILEKRPKEVLMRRSSMRLKRIDPEGIPLPELPPDVPVQSEHERKPTGPLDFVDNMYTGKQNTDKASQVVSSLNTITWTQSNAKVKKADDPITNGYIKSLSRLTLTEDRVAKVVPQRIFSVAIHPSMDKVITACGDKWGRLGLWFVEDCVPGDDGVLCFEPHSRPIPHIEFHPENSGKLVSCSYDGTVRCMDIAKHVFDEIYATPDDDDIRVSGFSFSSPDTILTAQGDGCVGIIDFRTPGTDAEQLHKAHDRNIKCVHVHPVHKQYFATASADSVVHVWDIRKMMKKKNDPLSSLRHLKSVDSAYFSPITGNQLLTTSIDNRIRIYDTSDLSQDIEQRCSIRHDNYTGRWLSNFRAIWHPRREDVFIVGSMERPRQIEMYSKEGSLVKHFRDPDHLGSVCSLNAFHPHRDILVGANSSGKLHCFM